MASRLSSSPVSPEIELTKAGEKLLHLPSSTKEFIKSLVQTENILSGIPSLSTSIIKPLRVIREALISKDLARHSDMTVKISVVCCICEILRIMAPDKPYDDNQMKEFFELVVTVFEKVSCSSGESYTKMIKVIETLSSGEIVVMMCHLQLNRLIVRLFKRFLTAAGLSSSDVVSKMEKIMTMIIKESKELPLELVNLLAMNGKSKNEIASPGRVQLAKKVLKNYADQLNPDIPDTTVSEKTTLEIFETPMPSKSVTTIQSVEHGENLVGSRIKVWWPEDRCYYEGTVKYFKPSNKKHKVWYDDGDKETIDLKKQKWELVEDVSPMLDCAKSAEHAENLVGSKIKVWWPAEKSYYEGVVESFDRSKMKHKVLYDDGDEDVLNLNQRQWTLIEDVSGKVPSDKVPPEKVSSPLAPPKKGVCAQALPIKDLSAQAPARITRASLKMFRSTQEQPEKVPSPLALPIPDELALPIKGSSTQTPPKKVLSTQAPPEKSLSPLAPPEKGVCAQVLPLKDPSAQALCKLVSATQTPTKRVSSTQAPPTKVSFIQSGLKSVQGYKVKKSVAPILEDIIKKHGDIASDCVFKTPSVRASLLEDICEVVGRIQTNDVADTISEMEEMQSQVSAAEANKINVSWLRQHLDAIQKRTETKENCSLLMKGKSSISLVSKAVKRDFEETRVQLLTAQEQFRKVERCVEVLKLVEKKLNDNLLEESNAASDSWITQPVL